MPSTPRKPTAPAAGPTIDHVEREIFIRASIERVFAGLTDPSHFPTWGPERIEEGTLAPGERPILDFGPGGRCRIYVVALQPPTYFAYRWAQGQTDPAILLGDPLASTHTLVEFHLDERDGGTRVRVVESGLSALPTATADHAALDPMREGWGLMLGGLHRALESGPVVFADRIEHTLELPAPPDRVYAALVDPTGWWAQRVDGALAPGATPILDFGPFGRVAVQVVAAEPSTRLAYRWIAGTDDPARRADDPTAHPSTLVEYTLSPSATGTTLHVVESGFAALPTDAARHHARATQAWHIILSMLRHHLA